MERIRGWRDKSASTHCRCSHYCHRSKCTEIGPAWRRAVLAEWHLGLRGVRWSCTYFPKEASGGDRRRRLGRRRGHVPDKVRNQSDSAGAERQAPSFKDNGEAVTCKPESRGQVQHCRLGGPGRK